MHKSKISSKIQGFRLKFQNIRSNNGRPNDQIVRELHYAMFDVRQRHQLFPYLHLQLIITVSLVHVNNDYGSFLQSALIVFIVAFPIQSWSFGFKL